MKAPPRDCCPTDLALEKYLLAEGEPGSLEQVRRHLGQCGRCHGHLAEMESDGARFRRSHHAVPARWLFTRAERNNARKLMLATALPVIALALGAAPAYRQLVGPKPSAAAEERSAPPAPESRPGLLEVREEPRPAALRQLSLRGQPIELGQGTLEAAEASGPARPFVLEHTAVDIEVSGFVQRATVRQVFQNPFASPVEAVYAFPLPDDAAVDELELKVGGRVIRGEIERREEARRRYEEAKSRGQRAALLDQERPNLFTQSVANILPGEAVEVRVRYAARLRYDDGIFELNFPMTVGPRYVPGVPLAGEMQGKGTSPDTDRVLDGSRITPPFARTGRDVEVRVRLEAGLCIESLWSVSHRLWAERTSPSSAKLSLDASDRIPNKDLIVRWTVAGPSLRAAAMTTGTGGTGTFALLLQPEAKDSQPAPVPREMVFVIDTSCSMSGAPLAAAKRVMSLALERLNPDDTFMLIDFADGASAFHDSPLPNSASYVERAQSYLEALPASGGTNQLAGIRAALGRPADPRRLRTVLFLTDGFIGNEVEVLGEAGRLLGSARLFALGMGTSVNHYLLSRLADSGRGFYQYLRPDEDPEPAIERFVRRIERPLLTDVSIDFGGLAVVQLLPAKLPDLFDAQPLVLLGRYQRPGRGTVTLRGSRAGSPVELKINLSLLEREERHTVLGTLWARARIDALERQMHQGERGDLIREITTLGLEHRLVTAYTSFVAVDATSAVARGTPTLHSTEAAELPQLTGAAEPGPAKRASSTSKPVRRPPLSRGWADGHGDVSGDGRGHAMGKQGGTYLLPPKEDVVPELAPRGAPMVMGSLSGEVIRSVVRRHVSDIRAAYQKRLTERPGLSGKLVVEFVIQADGAVRDARVKSSTVGDPDFEQAVLRLVRKWRFSPAPGGGEIAVSYPFVFSPGP
ncbi:MAG: TonB family protein [Myxococcales bacterium]|nr:TonB family protein [Myxococcales bacterium]